MKQRPHSVEPSQQAFQAVAMRAARLSGLASKRASPSHTTSGVSSSTTGPSFRRYSNSGQSDAIELRPPISPRNPRRKSWVVRVAYVAASQDLVWGEFYHLQKHPARKVWNNLKGRAYRIQLLKGDKLVCECHETVKVDDPDLWKAFSDG